MKKHITELLYPKLIDHVIGGLIVRCNAMKRSDLMYGITWITLLQYRTVARKFSIGGLCSSAGGLCVCAGKLDIIKFTKSPPIYSVSRFNLGRLGTLFGGLSPPKSPVATGLLQ